MKVPFADKSVTVDQGTRTITINAMAGGRTSSVSLFEDGSASTGLSCTQSPAVGAFFVSGNVLSWNPGFQPATPAQGHFSCTTSGGTVKFVFNSSASSLQVVSSGWNAVTSGGQGTSIAPSISADGKVLTWSTQGGTSSGHRQIVDLDLSSGARSVSSASSAAVIGNFPSEESQVSADGRYVLFKSISTNLVSGAGSSSLYLWQSFRKDRQTGAIDLVSSTDGTGANQANQPVWYPRISGNGRYVVFGTTASNLFAGVPSNGAKTQILRKDLQTGEIKLVSSPTGLAAGQGNDTSERPDISDDGRYVVFASRSSNFVGGTAGYQIYRKDMVAGTLELASSPDGTGPSAANFGGAASEGTRVSSDGRYVVFTSPATNLVTGASGQQAYRKDMQTGAIELVSSTDGLAGNQANSAALYAKISGDGRHVLFESTATNFVAGVPAFKVQTYRKDMVSNVLTLVSSTDGTGPNANRGGNGTSYPEISADGRYVTLSTPTNNWGSGDFGNSYRVYRKDMQTGTLTLMSSGDTGAVAQADGSTYGLRMSADGRYVVMDSNAKNLMPGLTTSYYQVFRKDLQTGEIALVSSTDGTAANAGDGSSRLPDISADGRYVVFYSDAPSLMGAYSQIYRKDMQTGIIELVSSVDGTAATASDYCDRPRISANGKHVAFECYDTVLVPGTSGGSSQIYVKNMQTGAITLVSSSNGAGANEGDSDSQSVTISADGRYAAFLTYASNIVANKNTAGQVLRKDLQLGTFAWVSSVDGTSGTQGNGDSDIMPEISADGKFVVFASWATNFVANLNGKEQVYRKNMDTQELVLVSSIDGTGNNEGNDYSSNPGVSTDGRYVVFSSSAGNLYPGAVAGRANIYRKDLTNGNIMLISSRDGAVGSVFDEYDEYNSAISPDGRYVVFQSQASNLMDGIYTGGVQTFIRDTLLP